MKIKIRVTPHASREEVIKQGDEYIVRVKEAPHDGKANEAVISILAKHFHVTRASVRIVSGMTGRNKIIEIRAGS